MSLLSHSLTSKRLGQYMKEANNSHQPCPQEPGTECILITNYSGQNYATFTQQSDGTFDREGG